MLALIFIFALLTAIIFPTPRRLQTASGSHTPAHFLLGTTNTRPKPKHPPPKSN